jgi:hypothetical protein
MGSGNTARQPNHQSALHFTRSWLYIRSQNRSKWENVKQRVKYLKRANVVLHSSCQPVPRMLARAKILGTPLTEQMPELPVFQQLSAEEPESPFSHMRFNTVSHGKLLVFSTGNIIRAGKYTHADAVACLLAFFKWARGQATELHSLWPSAIGMPNAVLTGQFNTPMLSTIKHHATAMSTDRFPGISIQIPSYCGENITPEIFLKASKWILPGARTPAGVFAAVVHLCELHKTHS